MTVIDCNRTEFVLAVKRAIHGQRPYTGTLAIKDFIAVDTSQKNGRLLVMGTNLNHQIVTAVQTEGSVNGGVIGVKARSLLTLLETSKSERIIGDLSASGPNRWTMGWTAGERAMSEITSSGDIFPPIINLPKTRQTVPDFLTALRSVRQAMDRYDERPVLKTAFLNPDGNGTDVVAADGFRMVRHPLDLKLKGPVMIPGESVDALLRAFGKKPKDADVIIWGGASNPHIAVGLGPSWMVTVPEKGRFPNYMKLWPENRTNTWILDRAQLLAAVQGAADSWNGILRLVMHNGTMTLTSKDEDRETSIRVEATGPKGMIAFNYRYLLEMLSIIQTEKVLCDFTTPRNPGLFRADGEEWPQVLIMPMFVQWN